MGSFPGDVFLGVYFEGNDNISCQYSPFGLWSSRFRFICDRHPGLSTTQLLLVIEEKCAFV